MSPSHPHPGTSPGSRRASAAGCSSPCRTACARPRSRHGRRARPAHPRRGSAGGFGCLPLARPRRFSRAATWPRGPRAPLPPAPQPAPPDGDGPHRACRARPRGGQSPSARPGDHPRQPRLPPPPGPEAPRSRLPVGDQRARTLVRHRAMLAGIGLELGAVDAHQAYAQQLHSLASSRTCKKLSDTAAKFSRRKRAIVSWSG